MNFLRKIFLKPDSRKDGFFFTKITKIVGFKPINIFYYQSAFTHRSSNSIDKQGNPINFERLEFLGDAMLSAIIAAYLFKEVPSGNEGYLTKMRSKIVSRDHLNELGRDLNLLDLIEKKKYITKIWRKYTWKYF